MARTTQQQQERYYQLDSDKPLPTDNACWGAYRIEKIRLIEKLKEKLK